MGLKKPYADEYHCPICGKEFICYTKDQWAYKGYFDGEKVLCSWTCMQAMRRKVEADRARKAERRGRRKKNEGRHDIS